MRPSTDDEIVTVLNQAMGTDLSVLEVEWKSRFHCEERQVTRYRHGRVFLAGDAAHVHSPMGGQGMNTGIQDAANLAWKIDAVLAGADDAVLDSYHEERHPIGKRVLFQSGLMARGVTLHPRVARKLRNLLVPRFLRVPRIRDAVAGSFAGTTLRYARHRGENPLVGTRATQIPLMAGPAHRVATGIARVRADSRAWRCSGRCDRSAPSGTVRWRPRSAGASRRLHRLGRQFG